MVAFPVIINYSSLDNNTQASWLFFSCKILPACLSDVGEYLTLASESFILTRVYSQVNHASCWCRCVPFRPLILFHTWWICGCVPFAALVVSFFNYMACGYYNYAYAKFHKYMIRLLAATEKPCLQRWSAKLTITTENYKIAWLTLDWLTLLKIMSM